MKKNKDKFLQHLADLAENTKNLLSQRTNLEWQDVELFLEIDRKFLEKIFLNLQKLENETMDVLDTSS